jgi:serine/threonine protein kinase
MGLGVLHRETTSLRALDSHLDLKPANIFVFRDSGPYSYTFKIGHQGLAAYFQDDITVSQDERDETIYDAPEDIPFHKSRWFEDENDSVKADIWSLGCILAETAVWTIRGEEGRESFQKLRQRTLKRPLDDTKEGYSSPFHDGSTRVEAVDQMLNIVLAQRATFDDLTWPICDILLKKDLLPRGQRCGDALKLCQDLKSVLRGPKQNSGHLPDTTVQDWNSASFMARKQKFGPIILFHRRKYNLLYTFRLLYTG